MATVYEVMEHNYLHGIKKQGVATLLHPLFAPGESEPYAYALMYHQTDVVTAYPDGSVKLDSGGYNIPRIYNGHRPVPSNTTKGRIAMYLPIGCRIYQEKNKWYISFQGGETAEFKDGMIVTESGVFATQEQAANQAEYEAFVTDKFYSR